MLPERPDLDQIRRQAKELRDAAQAGEAAAVARLARLDLDTTTLADAQLAIAREHGFANWPALKAAVDARVADVARHMDTFLRASVRGSLRTAVSILAQDPSIANDIRGALVLGDVDRVRAELARDPGLVHRRDEEWGWSPLLAVCNSRWHRDPKRGEALAEIARLLLDAGADPNTTVGSPGDRGYCTTLFGAAGCSNNPAITRLLLERGAVPDDHTLYLTAFDSGHECLRMLLPYVKDIATSTALGATISMNDVEGTRLLLGAGVDPNHPLRADLFGDHLAAEPPIPTVAAAVEFGRGPDVVRILVEAGADPNAPGRGAYSPYRLALRQGDVELADWLVAHGATPDMTDSDRLLVACLRGDRAEARRLDGVDVPPTDQSVAFTRAAEVGDVAAVELMLDMGFDPLVRDADDGATPLHKAAYAGSVDVVRLLLAHGADINAEDEQWYSPPVDWAIVGSGPREREKPHSDFIATVRALVDAGADLSGVSWNDVKPPSEEVAALLATYGITP
jgi:ankyrin repeat protein